MALLNPTSRGLHHNLADHVLHMCLTLTPQSLGSEFLGSPEHRGVSYDQVQVSTLYFHKHRAESPTPGHVPSIILVCPCRASVISCSRPSMPSTKKLNDLAPPRLKSEATTQVRSTEYIKKHFWVLANLNNPVYCQVQGPVSEPVGWCCCSGTLCGERHTSATNLGPIGVIPAIPSI